MAALTQGRQAYRRYRGTGSVPIAATTTVYQGGIVCMNASGYGVPGSTTTGLIALGVADPNDGLDRYDNSAGAAGDLDVSYTEGIFGFGNSGGGDTIADDDRGKPCYIVDDQTVALTDNSGARSPAGRVHSVESSIVYVEMTETIARQIAEEQIISTGQTYTQTYSTANRTVANPTGTAIGATLTDSTGYSGTHDDTLAVTTVPTALQENGGAIGGTNDGNLPDLTVTASAVGGGADGTTWSGAQCGAAFNDITDLTAAVRENAAKINAILTLLGVMAQNASDTGQKVIELVTLGNALVADDLDNRQTITAVIDDLQTADIVD